MSKIFEKIKKELDEKKIKYQLFEHDYVHRSEEAAKVRGTKLEEACKALIFKTKSGKFLLIAISGDKRVSLKKLKKLLNEKNVALASPEEVEELTGLKIGSIAPFPKLYGEKGIKGYADKSIFRNEHLVFSAGSHYKSIRMKSKDWQEINQLEVIDIAREE